MGKIRLRALTPIHIGGGTEELTYGLDFLRLGNYLYVLNKDRLYECLYERGLFDRFLVGLDRAEWVEEFLKEHGLLKQEILEELSYYKITVGALMPNRIRPFVRDIFGRAFLPGSSIKGVLRSSLIYSYASSLEPKELGRRYLDSINKLEQRERRRSEQAKKVGEFLSDELSKFFLPNAKEKPHRDIFRVVSFKDSPPLKEDALRIYEARLINDNGQLSGFCVPVEALKSGTEIELGISLNEGLFNEFESKNKGKLPFSSLDGLFDIAADFGGKILDFETSFFNKSRGSRSLAAITSGFKGKAVGKADWGSGLEAITVFSLLPADMREEVRRRFYPRSNRAVFPRTRRVIVERDKPVSPVGWFEFRYEP